MYQRVQEKKRDGGYSILELIFKNNHELITNIHIQTSEITDHEYITCETSHKLSTNEVVHEHENKTNLSAYNYETADWKNIKKSLKKINWPDKLKKLKSSEEKLKLILEIVTNIIEENCIRFRH